jgi:hypothetical protein
VNNTLSQADRVKLAVAQNLQIRRERWIATLEALPQPKAEVSEFPYGTLDEALDDGFRRLEGGSEGLMKLAKAAWKTKQWRAAAERNRAARDAAAEAAEQSTEAKIAEAVAEHVR